MPISLENRRVQAGQYLRGSVEAKPGAILRLRGGVASFRLDPEASMQEWTSDARVLVWKEQRLESSKEAFSFLISEQCLPSATGKRFRVEYVLELYGAGLDTESIEIQVCAVSKTVRSKTVLHLSLGQDENNALDYDEAQEDEIDEDAPEAPAFAAPSSFLERLLGGDQRMDMILERAVRGKLLEPEELLSMQASLYDYSKALVRIPYRQETEALLQDEVWKIHLESDSVMMGESICLKCDILPAKARQIHVSVLQHQRTRCHGIETLLEETIAEAAWAAKEQNEFQLGVPHKLLPSFQGEHVWVAYLLSVHIKLDSTHLRASHWIQVLSS